MGEMYSATLCPGRSKPSHNQFLSEQHSKYQAETRFGHRTRHHLASIRAAGQLLMPGLHRRGKEDTRSLRVRDMTCQRMFFSDSAVT